NQKTGEFVVRGPTGESITLDPVALEDLSIGIKRAGNICQLRRIDTVLETTLKEVSPTKESELNFIRTTTNIGIVTSRLVRVTAEAEVFGTLLMTKSLPFISLCIQRTAGFRSALNFVHSCSALGIVKFAN